MKNILSAFLLLVLAPHLKSQAVFLHVTSVANIDNHITELDHPQLNEKPSAILFVMPVRNFESSDIDYGNNVGVWYNDYKKKWTIFNQNTRKPMPSGIAFNIMVVPEGTPGVFVHTCTSDNTGVKAGTDKNTTILNNPYCNGKADAILIITQNWLNKYNDNAQQVSNSGGCGSKEEVRWSISNNATLPDGSDRGKSTMPVNARFNVMVIENGIVPGFSKASAFIHIADKKNLATPNDSSSTYIDYPAANGQPNNMVFATPFWGKGTACTEGPYNLGPISIKYSKLGDKLQDRWAIKYAESKISMPLGSKFNVVVVPPIKHQTWYFSPLTAVGVGPNGLTTKKIDVNPYCCPGDAIEITAEAGASDIESQWVKIPLSLPAGKIHEVTVCYSTKGNSNDSYISQLRLDKMTMPNMAQIVFDQDLKLASNTATCHSAKVNDIVIDGAITLSIQVVVAKTASIQIGSISLDFSPY